MPKSKPSTSCHLKAIVPEFGDDVFPTVGKILFNKMCKTKVAAKRKFTVQQHMGREKHIRAMQLATKKNTQLLLDETGSMKDTKPSDFHKNFYEPLVSANIPFSTLNNAKLKSFLELHFRRPIPDESSMLQLYQRMRKCFSR
jgi:hypothetical protein